ncbi:helix-turn-helix domain-containing protein [Clostridium sp. WILCCON 0269]|uniref:Helix-turn-helix domain-containing protein n=1 Tax=Candidatus Clostridium eludens TaxID=3381663 RepID=A0ABW8SP12_9CLOT
MAFGNRLKLLREEHGLTQQMVATILKVERPTIAGYETNRKQPDYEKINILADYFNVSIDYLLGRSDIRNPYNNSSTQNPKSLGKIISEYREKNNLSLKDFATKTDLDYEYVDDLEKEKVLKSPSLGDICKIAQSMNIPEMDLLEQVGYVKPNPESDKILKKCNELLEDYIKSHKNDDEGKIRSKGLYTTLLIKKLFEDGLINNDGEIDDSYIELIKASLKTDSKLLNKDNK